MRITIALCFVFGLTSVSMAQCLNGTCNLAPKVADTVRAVVSVPVRLVASVTPVEMDNSLAVVAAVEDYRAVARRTSVRTILRSPFAARPLQRLFRCR